MHRTTNPNFGILESAVDQLGELADHLVFLGGCATGLLLTDVAAPPIRYTHDVDVITEVATMAEYYRLADRLREKGFQEDTSENAPICRWKAGGILLDVMPTNPALLGFGSTWYQEALEAAALQSLPSGKRIRMITAPYNGNIIYPFIMIALETSMRRSAITHLVQAGVDLPTVQRISGHKTLQMVARYSHQNGEHIQAAMDVLEKRYKQIAMKVIEKLSRERLPREEIFGKADFLCVGFRKNLKFEQQPGAVLNFQPVYKGLSPVPGSLSLPPRHSGPASTIFHA